MGRLSFLNSYKWHKISEVQFLKLKIPKKLYKAHPKPHRSNLTWLSGGGERNPSPNAHSLWRQSTDIVYILYRVQLCLKRLNVQYSVLPQHWFHIIIVNVNNHSDVCLWKHAAVNSSRQAGSSVYIQRRNLCTKYMRMNFPKELQCTGCPCQTHSSTQAYDVSEYSASALRCSKLDVN